MQSLEIISVNIWQILISLINLVLLFLILKKFLFKPVKKAVADRESAISEQYDRAAAAEADAMQKKQQWEETLAGADEQADQILRRASENAEKRGREIVAESQVAAQRILEQAEADAALERKKAEAGIKTELVDLSTALSEKMLEREITPDDHRAMIDRFLSEIGEDQ